MKRVFFSTKPLVCCHTQTKFFQNVVGLPSSLKKHVWMIIFLEFKPELIGQSVVSKSKGQTMANVLFRVTLLTWNSMPSNLTEKGLYSDVPNDISSHFRFSNSLQDVPPWTVKRRKLHQKFRCNFTEIFGKCFFFIM